MSKLTISNDTKPAETAEDASSALVPIDSPNDDGFSESEEEPDQPNNTFVDSVSPIAMVYDGKNLIELKQNGVTKIEFARNTLTSAVKKLNEFGYNFINSVDFCERTKVHAVCYDGSDDDDGYQKNSSSEYLTWEHEDWEHFRVITKAKSSGSYGAKNRRAVIFFSLKDEQE